LTSVQADPPRRREIVVRFRVAPTAQNLEISPRLASERAVMPMMHLDRVPRNVKLASLTLDVYIDHPAGGIKGVDDMAKAIRETSTTQNLERNDSLVGIVRDRSVYRDL
jgi:hypothetical protein